MLYRIGRRPGGKNLHWQHDSITVTELTTFLLQLKTEVNLYVERWILFRYYQKAEKEIAGGD
jgi:hypothetical protein